MTSSSKRPGLVDGLTGATGIALLACTACCIPLLAPVLAWIGVAALGLQVSSGSIAVGTGAVVVAGLVAWRQRQRRSCATSAADGCGNQFKPNTPGKPEGDLDS